MMTECCGLSVVKMWIDLNINPIIFLSPEAENGSWLREKREKILFLMSQLKIETGKYLEKKLMLTNQSFEVLRGTLMEAFVFRWYLRTQIGIEVKSREAYTLWEQKRLIDSTVLPIKREVYWYVQIFLMMKIIEQDRVITQQRNFLRFKTRNKP